MASGVWSMAQTGRHIQYLMFLERGAQGPENHTPSQNFRHNQVRLSIRQFALQGDLEDFGWSWQFGGLALGEVSLQFFPAPRPGRQKQRLRRSQGTS
jgi:hypothetical protein